MALILHIESTTTVCSVALSENGQLLFLKEKNEGYTHAEYLALFIDEIIQQNGKSYSALDAIAISTGPGSYTGLRIGTATAKGICYSLDKPLIAVNTLQYMAMSIPGKSGYRVPMLDARRMEVYCAVYNERGEEILPVQAKIIDQQSFSDLLHQDTLIFFGDGAPKCREVIQHPNAVFLNHATPSASQMITLAEAKFREGKFEATAYFEPTYLKEFIAGKKKDPAV